MNTLLQLLVVVTAWSLAIMPVARFITPGTSMPDFMYWYYGVLGWALIIAFLMCNK